MNKRSVHHFSAIPSQKGAALIIALVFLIALTLLGLAATGGNTLQQRMTYSVGETNLAFQSAESGLSAGEAWLEARIDKPSADCSGNCGGTASIWPGRPTSGTPQVSLANLRNFTWWTNQGRLFGHTYTEGATASLVPGQQFSVGGEAIPLDSARYPRYVVEEMGKDPTGTLVVGGPQLYTLWFYQISARGTGAQTNPPAIVQSVYSKGF